MIATSCLVQWYEIDMFEEYIDSLVLSIGNNKDKVLIDVCLVNNQDLEKINKEVEMFSYIMEKFVRVCNKLKLKGYRITYRITSDLYTIADYRREFNDKFSKLADILFWGESDMLVPSQAIPSILLLNNAVKDTTPKWIGFFATCKMWDDSWKVLEHPKLTNLERDPYAWYGTRSYMSYDKMEEINSDVDSPQIETTDNYKFNGCGLIMSSELINSGVNIPASCFFTHEDTALMNKMLLMFNKEVPMYIFKNILLVHNREHPNKRKYIAKEKGKDINEQRKSNDWYKIASEMSKQNAYNFMKQTKSFKWKDVWEAL
jgi:hypothetical protein|tara:strand:- start:3071 stop:4018 length:948 start_codon:yes stop_codon:yes gene_type:complete